MKGFIYVLSNPSFKKQIYKIGITTRTPRRRAWELSSASGIPTPFKVEFSVQVENFAAAEILVHFILEKRGCRIAGNREFFCASLQEIKKVLGSFQKEEIHIKASKFQVQLKEVIHKK